MRVSGFVVRSFKSRNRSEYPMTRKHKPAPAPRKPVARAAAAPHRKSAPAPAARVAPAAPKVAEPHHKADSHRKTAVAAKAAPPPAGHKPGEKAHAGSAASKGATLATVGGEPRRGHGLPEDRQSQLKLLIARGKEQGYLTYAQVNDHLPAEIVDPEQIEGIVNTINDMGIPVYEKAPDTESLLATEPASPADDEAIEEAAAALAALDAELGRTTDPVRMYMREMGTVELPMSLMV